MAYVRTESALAPSGGQKPALPRRAHVGLINFPQKQLFRLKLWGAVNTLVSPWQGGLEAKLAGLARA